jgi:hypothetical protein
VKVVVLPGHDCLDYPCSCARVQSLRTCTLRQMEGWTLLSVILIWYTALSLTATIASPHLPCRAVDRLGSSSTPHFP